MLRRAARKTLQKTKIEPNIRIARHAAERQSRGFFAIRRSSAYLDLAFSPEGIKNLCSWEEGSVYLHLDDCTAESLVYTGPFEHYEDFAEDCSEYDGIIPPEDGEIPVWNYDMEEISFDDLKDAEKALEKVCDTSWYFKDKLGRYCGVWA